MSIMQQITEFVTVNWELCLLLAIILFMLARTYQGPAYLKGLRPLEAVQKMNRHDALILDVRSDEEYKIGHISHSIHIPLDKLASRIVDLDKYKDKPVIIGCRSGNRSAQAGVILHKQGFGELYNLLGGVVAWQSANLPLTTKKDQPTKKSTNKHSNKTPNTKSGKSKPQPKDSKQTSMEKNSKQNSELPALSNEVNDTSPAEK
jgi:rhodanese-related sulfurtransferase